MTKLRAGRPKNRSIPRRGKKFSFFHSVQTHSGVHPASHPTETGILFSRGTTTGALITHLHLVRVEECVELISTFPIRLPYVVLNWAQSQFYRGDLSKEALTIEVIYRKKHWLVGTYFVLRHYVILSHDIRCALKGCPDHPSLEVTLP
jgi:hypothetical protein